MGTLKPFINFKVSILKTEMMKKIIFIVLIVPLLSLTLSNNTATEAEFNANFSGRHCRGTQGLCSVNKSSRSTETNTRITYNLNHSITFTIYRNKLNPYQEIQILGQPNNDIEDTSKLFYIMDYDFELDTTLCRDLEISTITSTIIKGRYPIQVKNNTFIITFKLE